VEPVLAVAVVGQMDVAEPDAVEAEPPGLGPVEVWVGQ
jgi:hypothetical protein